MNLKAILVTRLRISPTIMEVIQPNNFADGPMTEKLHLKTMLFSRRNISQMLDPFNASQEKIPDNLPIFQLLGSVALVGIFGDRDPPGEGL